MPRTPCACAPVAYNCKNCLAHRCDAYCVEGSEYDPIDPKIPLPLVMERKKAKRQAKVEHRASKAYRTGKSSYYKGRHLEEQLARLVHGKNVPLSGSLPGHPFDVIAMNGWGLESKGRQETLGLVYGWLRESNADIVAFREAEDPDAGWLFAMRLEWFLLRQHPAQPKTPEANPLFMFTALGPDAGAAVEVLGQRFSVELRKSGFSTIRKWLANEGADMLCVKANDKGWIAIMDRAHLEVLILAPIFNHEVA